MIFSLVISLILTLIIEIATSFIIGIRNKDDIEIVIVANIITNPVVVFVTNCILALNNMIVYNIVVAFMEILAVIIEAILYKDLLKYKDKSPWLISIFNNVVSFSIGVIINIIM